METNQVNEETARERYVRMRDGPVDHLTIVTFNVAPFRGRYVFRTKRQVGHDVFECACTKVQELFLSLLAAHPEYLERTKHIEDSIQYPSDQPMRDFAMIVDNNPKQGQEPFIFVELLNVDHPHPDPQKRSKYFKNLDHFITTFLNV